MPYISKHLSPKYYSVIQTQSIKKTIITSRGTRPKPPRKRKPTSKRAPSALRRCAPIRGHFGLVRKLASLSTFLAPLKMASARGKHRIPRFPGERNRATDWLRSTGRSERCRYWPKRMPPLLKYVILLSLLSFLVARKESGAADIVVCRLLAVAFWLQERYFSAFACFV